MQIEIMSDFLRPLLSGTEADQAWMSICDELPTTLQAVSIVIEEHWRFCTYAEATETKIRNLARAADLLSTLRKRVLRRIPGVKTFFGGMVYEHMSQEDRAFVRRAWDEDVDS